MDRYPFHTLLIRHRRHGTSVHRHRHFDSYFWFYIFVHRAIRRRIQYGRPRIAHIKRKKYEATRNSATRHAFRCRSRFIRYEYPLPFWRPLLLVARLHCICGIYIYRRSLTSLRGILTNTYGSAWPMIVHSRRIRTEVSYILAETAMIRSRIRSRRRVAATAISGCLEHLGIISRFGKRRVLEISIAKVSIVVSPEDGRIEMHATLGNGHGR